MATPHPVGTNTVRRSEVTRAAHGHLISAQVVNQRLNVGENTFGVWFITHDHHVLHFQQRHAVDVGPRGEGKQDRVNERL